MQLSAELRRFLALHQALVPAAINFLLNGAIAWALFRELEHVPLWGGQSNIGSDTLITCFLLPAITCLIVTPLVRAQAKKGQAPALSGALPGWLAAFQHALPVRAAAIGLAGTLVASAAVLGGLGVAGVETLAVTPFVTFKAFYTAALAALVTPAIALLALADRPER
jgi:hypothetical protein